MAGLGRRGRCEELKGKEESMAEQMSAALEQRTEMIQASLQASIVQIYQSCYQQASIVQVCLYLH